MSHGDEHGIRRDPGAQRITSARHETEYRIGAEPNAGARNGNRGIEDSGESADALKVPMKERVTHNSTQFN
jgi:hypothetical protein